MVHEVGAGTSLTALVRSARDDGRQVLVVPAGATVAQSLDWFAESLRLPEWFGRNLDALADCLHDLAEEDPHEGTDGRVLVWDRVAALKVVDPDGFDGIRSVLVEVEDEHPSLAVVVVDR
ncbi:barstar family protein [Phycicoccus sp. M110.8]|uniref:barstar family protein n=1 Tax=Phycicoccus sp. M110.8 TaxID=3075433 RepID=UPI0028FD98D4|nr:barstar family protein [Phycicoccus sp. M110.8]MDU0314511.1 barstar family protein [Phycicoccus sp. M110.8]